MTTTRSPRRTALAASLTALTLVLAVAWIAASPALLGTLALYASLTVGFFALVAAYGQRHEAAHARSAR